MSVTIGNKKYQPVPKTLNEYGVQGMKWGVSTNKMPFDKGKGSMKGAFNRIPVSRVFLGGAEQYKSELGRLPKGKGRWAFELGGKTRFVKGIQSYSAAAKQIKKLASRAGIRSVKVTT